MKRQITRKDVMRGYIGCVIIFFIIVGIGAGFLGNYTYRKNNPTVSEVIHAKNAPEHNTKEMVEYLARAARKAANSGINVSKAVRKSSKNGVTDEKRDEAINFIKENYPNYFTDNETAEKSIYYGYYLEYAYTSNNDTSTLYRNMGKSVESAVKGVYLNTDTVESDTVQENLKQIGNYLSQIN